MRNIFILMALAIVLLGTATATVPLINPATQINWSKPLSANANITFNGGYLLGSRDVCMVYNLTVPIAINRTGDVIASGDDETVIQAAIDDVASSGGGTVKLVGNFTFNDWQAGQAHAPYGVFNAGIFVRDGVVLDGYDACITATYSTFPEIFNGIIGIEDNDNATIIGLEIDGSAMSTSPEPHYTSGIWDNYGGNVSIYDCYIHDVYGFQIHTRNDNIYARSDVYHNRAVGVGSNDVLGGSGYNHFYRDNQATQDITQGKGSYMGGIVISHAIQCDISNNVVRGVVGFGADDTLEYQGSNHLRGSIDGNQLYPAIGNPNQADIFIHPQSPYSADYISVTKNKLYYGAIYLYPGCENCIVSENDIQFGRIQVDSCDRIMVNENVINGSWTDYAGILAINSHNCTISLNDVSYATWHGIHANQECANNTIVNNRLLNCAIGCGTCSGIYNQGESSIVSFNYATDTRTPRLHYSGITLAAHDVAIGNIVSGYSADGIITATDAINDHYQIWP